MPVVSTMRKRTSLRIILSKASAARSSGIISIVGRTPLDALNVHGKQVPDWARVFADSWGRFFLKHLLADPRVTAVIPGTGDARHITDNAGAIRGPFA
jgi:hypothetical protein